MEDATQTDNGTLASAALVTCPAWGPKPGKGLAQNSLRQNGTQLPKSGGMEAMQKNIHVLHIQVSLVMYM